jgi:phage portal protein BeeE
VARILSLGTPVVSRSREPAPEAGGGWLASRAMSERERRGLFVGPYLPSVDVPGNRRYYSSSPDRFLSNMELWTVYRRTPDVRAAVDSIVRRVATFDWLVDVVADPSSDLYEQAAEEAERVRRFLSAPNSNGETWQETMTTFLTDLLVYDAGVMEIVRDATGSVSELVPLKGSTMLPVIDDHGKVLSYEQDLTSEAHLGGYIGVKAADSRNLVRFEKEDVLYLRLFPTTSTPLGNPLIESLVTEVISLLRGSEHAMLALDADEIPPGILVLAGLAGRAAEIAAADLQHLRGQDHKIRVLTTPDPTGIGAKWVEMRRTPKDVQMREILDDIRRTVWRVFGVQPIEMGAAEGVNRATAEVQVDVSTSYLVTPILELLAAKINTRIIPLLIEDEQVRSLVEFSFDRAARETPEQEKARADKHRVYVESGILTRNEARSEIGLLPIEGGDVPTVSTPAGPMPLASFVASGSSSTEPPPSGGGGGSPPPDGGISGEPGGGSPGEPAPPAPGDAEEGVSDPEAGDGADGEAAPGEVEASRLFEPVAFDRAEGKVSKQVEARLREVLDEHNEQVGDDARKRTTFAALVEVFRRGVGAYINNPESVRPTVKSPEQWAYARVNSFLYVLRNLRFRRGTHDTDLLPPEHPLSSKDKEDREVARLTDLPRASLDTPWGWDEQEVERVLGDPPDFDRLRSATLWRDPRRADEIGGYKFPIARMIDGRLTVVFRGVAAVVGALREDGKHESLDGVPEADLLGVYRVVRRYYEEFGEEPPSIARFDEQVEGIRAVRAVGDTDPTNFPASGDDERVSLANSRFDVFDARYAERLRVQYPEVWGRGGNVLGNTQYRRLRPVVARGGSVETETEEEAVRLREAWSARHFRDFRLAGVVAQIKWYTVGSRGEDYMKSLVDEEIARVDRERSRLVSDLLPFVSSVDERGACAGGWCAHGRSVSPDDRERDEWFARAKALPSEWIRPGKFARVRTLDLEELGTSVSLYITDLVPLWRSARDEVVASTLAAARRAKTPEELSSRVNGATNRVLDRLATEWTATSSPLYRRAATIGERSAYRFSGSSVDADVISSRASSYGAEQEGYLRANGGLLSSVSTRISGAVAAFASSRFGAEAARASTEIPDTGAGSEEWWGALLADEIAAAWDANEHRIDLYAGRLVDVASSAFAFSLEATATVAEGTIEEPRPGAGPAARTEWWCEWVMTLDDATCPTCRREGNNGFVPLSSLTVKPGGGTECNGRCRCVLVVWTKDEVTSGDAFRLGPM